MDAMSWAFFLVLFGAVVWLMSLLGRQGCRVQEITADEWRQGLGAYAPPPTKRLCGGPAKAFNNSSSPADNIYPISHSPTASSAVQTRRYCVHFCLKPFIRKGPTDFIASIYSLKGGMPYSFLL